MEKEEEIESEETLSESSGEEEETIQEQKQEESETIDEEEKEEINQENAYENIRKDLSDEQFQLFLKIKNREFIRSSDEQIKNYILANENLKYNALLKLIENGYKQTKKVEKNEEKIEKKIEKKKEQEEAKLVKYMKKLGVADSKLIEKKASQQKEENFQNQKQEPSASLINDKKVKIDETDAEQRELKQNIIDNNVIIHELKSNTNGADSAELKFLKANIEELKQQNQELLDKLKIKKEKYKKKVQTEVQNALDKQEEEEDQKKKQTEEIKSVVRGELLSNKYANVKSKKQFFW